MTGEDCSHDSAHESNTNRIVDRADVIDKSEEDECNDDEDEEDCDEDELVSEGMFYKDRATALLEYGAWEQDDAILMRHVLVTFAPCLLAIE